MDYAKQWLLTHSWVAEFSVFLLLLYFLNFLLKKVLRANQSNSWWITFASAILPPARVLLSVVALVFFLDFLGQRLKIKEVDVYSPLLMNATIALCFSWFLFRWKNGLYKQVRSKGNESLDHISLELIDKVATIAILFISALVLFSALHVDIVPLVTFGGIGAAALGFASKDVIANFFGGFTLHASQPFVLHDLIELPQKNLLGHVEKIGWYFTSIRALDKKLVYIPNYLFPTEMMINQSRMSHRYLNELIQFSWEDLDKLPTFIEEFRTHLSHSQAIDQSLPRHVFISKLTEYTIDLEVKAHTYATRYEEFMQVRQHILLELCQIAQRHGLSRPITSIRIIQK